MTVRTLWFAPDLGIVDEPLWKALVTYRQNNRERVQTPRKFPTYMPDLKAPNLVSSRTTDGRQMPILDIDVATEKFGNIITFEVAESSKFSRWLLTKVWNYVLNH